MARRSRGHQQSQTLVAAAKRITLNDSKLSKGKTRTRVEWQDEAWAYFDEVPEIKYSVRFLGNAMAKLRLFVGVIPAEAEPDADPVPVNDGTSDVPQPLAAAAIAELDRLRSQIGGQAAIQARMNMNLEVAGELYLIGWGAQDAVGVPGSSDYRAPIPEDWQVGSVKEVEVKGGKWVVKSSANDSKGRELNLGSDTEPGRDTIIHLWEPHPAWQNQADCAMRGVLNDAKTLQVLTQQQYAEGLSRQSAGILLIPNELSTGPASSSDPEDDDGEPTDPFISELLHAMTDPIEDPSSASSVMPMVVKGNSEVLDKVRHLVLGRQSDAVIDQRISARIERIARGMNLPVEVVMGHQQTTYANAEQVDQDTFEDHLEPRCRLIADALTVGYLRPNLLDAGHDAEQVNRLVVWYDASALVRQPDTELGADSAFDRFAISAAAYRRAKGYTEDDAPDPLEVLVRSGLRRGILTAELTSALIDSLADEAGVDLPSAPAELVPGEPVADDGSVDAAARAQMIEALVAAAFTTRKTQRKRSSRHLELPAARSAQSSLTAARARSRNPGTDLMLLDRELRTRLHVAAEATMTRALERAGAKLRTKANGMRTSLRSIDNLHIAATLGPTLALQAATTDELLPDDAWDDLERQFRSWAENTQDDALNIVGQAVSGFTTAEREALKLRQLADLDEAWVWMREALSALAAQRMFDPDPAAPILGEFDPSMRVPPGLIRQAMARSGGASGLTTGGGGDAWVALADGGTRPAGGIGTGELMRGVLRDHGTPIEGYRWVYGPAMRQRPFVPHRELDGLEFVNFDDDVLANTDSFPEAAYYMPGDHDGCICDVEPIIIPADEA